MTTIVSDPALLSPHVFATDLARHRDRVAIVSDGDAITYAELDDRVQQWAGRLGANRRLVLLGAQNTLDALVAYLGALSGGHPVLLTSDDDASMRSLLATYDPDVVVTAAEGWAVEERRPRSAHCLHPDLALLLSTSGSTGSSKLVRLSLANLRANAEAITQYLALTNDDRAITTLPMQYCFGLSVINSHLHAGASIVLTELSVVDRCFWELFASTGATNLAGVPHTFDLLDRIGFEAMALPSLRFVTQAGGRLHPDKVRRFATVGAAAGWDLFVMYGQTEATARMAYLPPSLAASHPEAIGVPIPGGELFIAAPDGDGVGELVYRGPNVMLGYAERPEDLMLGATLRELRTGDLARLTATGLYELVGRRSRFVKPFGLRVDLDQVERLLARRGITAMCAGDDEHLVVAVTDAEPAAVLAAIGEHLDLPTSRVRVVVVGELPRLPTGKPDYVSLLHSEDAGTRAIPPPSPAIDDDTHAHRVRRAFADTLGVDPADDDSFVGLGGDSLCYVEMSIRLEEALGTLPRDWHLVPVAELAPAPRRRRLAQTETGVVLRAAAIVLVVGTHAELWDLPGGAHSLLGVAGYNFARFSVRARSRVGSIARIALPSMAWIGLVVAVGDRYEWPHALLLNGFIGGPDARWSYWYVEAAVQILAVLALLLTVPALRRLEGRRPFPFAMAAVAVGLAVRFDLLGLASSTHRFTRPQDVFWLFALGWAAARATATHQRLLVSALISVSVIGFFGDLQRELIVMTALLLLVWVPSIPLPRRLTPILGAVAAASLYIYLSHWQVYPPLLRLHGSALAVAGSLLAGVVLWLLARRAVDAAVEAPQRAALRVRRRRPVVESVS